MEISKNRWCGVIASAALFIVAGNAWGFGIKTDSGDWGYASPWSSVDHYSGDHGGSGDSFGDHWPEKFTSGFPGRFGGGMMDDDSDSASGPGFDFGYNWGSSWGDGGRFGHDWWREFLLHDGMAGSGLAEWFERKKQFWTLLIEHWHDHQPATQVPLPASILFFGSGLAGLIGFVRRSRKVAVPR